MTQLRAWLKFHVMRNAMGSGNALISADLALAGVEEIPVDEVIEAMDKVGRNLPASLRELDLVA